IVDRFNTWNGLPSNFIFKIVEDKNRDIWMSSSKGLACLKPDKKMIKVFTSSSGLINDQFNYNSGYKDTAGNLYFGSVIGMIKFRPEKCLSNPIVPPVYITGFQVNNKELEITNKNSPERESVTYTRELILDYDQASFSLDFAALSFTSPDVTVYKYIMDGLDRDWTELTTNRKVYFTDLSPGTYHFRVKAALNNEWTNNITSLTIRIKPPIWASAWAYLFYGVMTLGLIYIALRFYHRRAQEKKEKEIYAAKIEFFTNVAHEIRTPLTLIKGPVENISEQIDQFPAIREDVHTLERNTDRLISLVSGVLDFRKTETTGFSLNFVKINIKQLIEENFLDFKPLAAKRNLAYTLDLENQSCFAYADEEALNKIISNLLSNAVKYAESYVNIKLQTSKENLAKVIVSSNGYKIPEETREKIFEPFFRIKATSKQRGAGIGLTLARSLALLHNGRLYLDTADEESNVFILELPLNLNLNQQKSAGLLKQQF
ncbi:MAG: hybrid sensor histidine kinase/response regulator, partial [Chitinophagaceae bacterium]